MNSGPFSQDTLLGVFRSLSGRKRNGVLQISSKQGLYEMSFLEGKIVDVKKNGNSGSKAVCNRLSTAGLATSEILQQLDKVDVALEELKDTLVGDGHVREEKFAQAKRAHELDLLHSLRRIEDGYITFTPKLIRVDKESSPGYFPGQILLDLFELKKDEPRFEQLLDSDSEEDVKIYRCTENPHGLTEAEKAVWSNLSGAVGGDGATHINLLSEFEFRQAFLSLYDREVIDVRQPGEEMSEEEEHLSDDQTADTLDDENNIEGYKEQVATPTTDLEDLFDSDSDSSGGEDDEPVQSQPEEVEADTDELIASLIDEASGLLKGMGEPNSESGSVLSEQEGGDDLTADLMAELESLENLEQPDDVDTTSAGSELTNSSVGMGAARDVFPGESVDDEELKGQLAVLNSVMLKRSISTASAVVVVLFFLFALALLGPSLITEWFKSISDFTSLM